MTRIELLERAKPILFNTEMVRAIQNNTKTVTRRVIKLKYGNTHIQWHKDKCGKHLVEMQNDVEGETYGVREDGTHWQKVLAMSKIKLPYKIGDILYVRETWCKGSLNYGEEQYFYKADGIIPHCTWSPSIHMPKEAARIFLRVTDVRVERLQNITPEDIIKEGFCEVFPAGIWQADFYNTWNSTIKPKDRTLYGWAANPWVFVIEFERVEVTK